MSFSTPNTTDPTPGQEQKPLVPQRGQPMPNVMIDDLDDPIPRSRSNPTFETSRRFPNDTLTPAVPGPSSMFQSARQFDIGGNPSFVTGTQHVYNYHHYNHSSGKLVHISSIESSARRSERRVGIIKDLGEEVKELNQRLQEKTEELSRVEGTTNRQAEKLKRLEGEVAKLNQLLQEKTTQLSQVEDASNRQAEKLKRLEGELAELNQFLHEKAEELSRVEGTANRQAEKLKQLEREVAKLNQLLQEKTTELSRVEDASNRQAEKLKRLEGELAELTQLLHEKTEELSRVEDTANRQNAKQIEELKQSNAKVGKLNQLLQEKTGELSRVEDASNRQAEELKRLQGEAGKLNQLLQEKTAGLASLEEAANRAKGRHETVVVGADGVSVAEVAHLVKTLNALIEQTVVLITESLSCLEPPVSDNKSEIAFDELHDHLGSWLYTRLRENSGLDLCITQIFALQAGLANMCCCIVNDSPFWCNGSIYRHIYRNMAETDQAVADEWRAQTLNYITLAQCEDANKTYLTDKVFKLVTVAVGGVPESSESLLSQYNQRVEEIARTAAKLHKTITEDVKSMELVTYTVPCDTEFNASQMEDTVNMSGSIPHGKVVCTHEMGLLCRKRVEPRRPRGSIKDWGVTMKAKVILAATLEADNDN